MEKKIAKALLEINAVFLRPNDPFTWASGIKSPIYCDNRLILSYPKTRTIVENGLAQLIKKEFPKCEVIMATATAGIAHGAIVSDILGLPMGYVRASAKDHGRSNQIEGKIPTNKKVVIIEDLISTAGSVIEVASALRNAKAEVLGVASIFTYNLQKGINRLSEANLKNVSLSNFDVLVEVAIEENYITSDDLTKVRKFQKNPSDGSWMSE